MNFVTNWVLKRKGATILITLLIFFLGLFAVTQLKSELLPNVSIPYLAVTTSYLGANSETVADKVSKLVEDAIAPIPRLKTVRSTSQESFSLVIAEFEFGTDIKDVQQSLANSYGWTLEIIKRSADLKGFVVLPKRGVVERTFGWFNGFRRLSKAYERKAATAEAFIYVTMTRLLLTRLQQPIS